MMWASVLVRIYIKITLPFIATFLALNAAASAVGSRQPPIPALEGFTVGCEGMSQPCWYGIVPGETTVEEAEQLLIQHHFVRREIGGFPLSYDPPPDSGLTFIGINYQLNMIVHHILIQPTTSIRVGDILAVTGIPDGLMHSGQYSDVYLVYESGGGNLRITFGRAPRKIHPFSDNLDHIALTNPFSRSRFSLKVLPWAGFMLLWRYCDFDAEFPFC